MTGTGGVVIAEIDYTPRFRKDYRKLPESLRRLVQDKLRDLQRNPMPPGLRFEKLKGYRNPSLYSFMSPETIRFRWKSGAVWRSCAGSPATTRSTGRPDGP